MYVLTKTLKKKSQDSLKKVRSYDDLHKTSELSLQDVKILLCCDHSENITDNLSHRIKKQEVLARNKLFDPLKFFGMTPCPVSYTHLDVYKRQLISYEQAVGTGEVTKF